MCNLPGFSKLWTLQKTLISTHDPPRLLVLVQQCWYSAVTHIHIASALDFALGHASSEHLDLTHTAQHSPQSSSAHSIYSWNLIGSSNTLTYLHFIIRIQPALYSLQSAATVRVVSCAGVTAKVIYSGGADLDILPQHASKGKGLEFLLGEVRHPPLRWSSLMTPRPSALHTSVPLFLYLKHLRNVESVPRRF